MKARKPSSHIYFSSRTARLYRDDLERIHSLIAEAGLKPSIADNNVGFESFKEVQEMRGDHPSTLLIEGSNERDMAVFSLSRSGRIWSLRAEAAGTLGHAVERLLRERTSWTERMPGIVLLIFSGFLLMNASMFAPWRYAFLIVGSAFVLTAIIIALHSLLGGGVNLRFKHESGLWIRHRKDIFLMVLGAAIVKAFDLLPWLWKLVTK